MAIYKGQTVDWHEDFEDALGGDWSETGTDHDPQDAAAPYPPSTYGLSVDFNASAVSFVQLDIDSGSPHSPVSFGFWFYTATVTGGQYAILWPGDASDSTCRVWWGIVPDSANLQLMLSTAYPDSGSGHGSTLTANTWYWVTVKATNAGTCSLRVYNTSGEEVGSVKEITGSARNVDRVAIGVIVDSGGVASDDGYYDDFVVDYTTYAYPLLGWTVGGDWTTYSDITMEFGT